MTPPELSAALRGLGWSVRDFASRTGHTRMACWRMIAGTVKVPADLARWLASARRWFERHPVPQRAQLKPEQHPRKETTP